VGSDQLGTGRSTRKSATSERDSAKESGPDFPSNWLGLAQKHTTEQALPVSGKFAA